MSPKVVLYLSESLGGATKSPNVKSPNEKIPTVEKRKKSS